MWELRPLMRAVRIAHALRPACQATLPPLLHPRRSFALHCSPPRHHSSDTGGATGSATETGDDYTTTRNNSSTRLRETSESRTDTPAEQRPSSPDATELDALPLPVHRPLHTARRGVTKPALVNLIDDKSIPTEELVRSTVEDFRKISGVIHAQLPLIRPSQDELAKLVDLSELEKAEKLMHDPKVHDYLLHRMDVISEEITLSVQSRLLFHRYLSREDLRRIHRHLGAEQDVVQTTAPGKCVHFQFVHPGIVAATRLRGSAAQRDTQPAVSSLTPAQQAEVKAARDVVERVLRRYVARMLEPYPNELVVDLSHYAAFLPLLMTARRNFTQLKKDVADYLAQKPVTKEGIAGPPRKKDIDPISPDDLAAEIARVIRRELPALQPRTDESNSSDSVDAVSSPTRPTLHLCIGVATTPVLAKIASDVEAASVLSRLREAALAETKAGARARRSGSNDTRGKDAIPSVSIRSFHRHLRSLKASREFMARFPVSRLPTLSPAFVVMLRRVFGITTCSDLYDKRIELYSCLSRETAGACFSAVYGRMRYEGEAAAGLHSPRNLLQSTRDLREVAENAVSIVNEDRTAYTTRMTQFQPRGVQKSGTVRAMTAGNVTVGRLVSVEAVCRSVTELLLLKHREAYAKGTTYKKVRLCLRQPSRRGFTRYLNFSGAFTERELVDAAESVVKEMMKQFDRNDPGEIKRPSSIVVIYSGLGTLPMVPPAMLKEADELVTMCMAVKGFLGRRRGRLIRQAAEQRHKEIAAGGELRLGTRHNSSAIYGVMMV